MRKFGMFLAVVVLFVLAVVPGFARDEPTIADIVVASTEADPAEFTVLLAAVGAADPAVLELLADPEAGVTVFAPTDAAFAAAFEALGVTPEDVLADTETLTEILLYHVVPGVFAAEDVIALDGAYFGTLLSGQALFVSLDGDAVFVNDSQIVATDVIAANGVVHVIDSVLLPVLDEAAEEGEMMMEEMGTIADIVVASTEADMPEFTVLLAAVAAADPGILESLTNGGPFTVFAPTDAAFAAALEALGLSAEELLADTETLTQILAYHVVPGAFAAEDILGLLEAGMEMEMEELLLATALPGTAISVALDGENVVINGGAIVAATDVMADNGIIHVIDAVLLPPSGE